MRGIIRENGPIFAAHRKKCNFDQNKKKIALLVQMGWGSKGAGGSAGAGQIFARSVNLTSQAHCVPAPSKKYQISRNFANFYNLSQKRFAFVLRLYTCKKGRGFNLLVFPWAKIKHILLLAWFRFNAFSVLFNPRWTVCFKHWKAKPLPQSQLHNFHGCVINMNYFQT